MTTGSVAGPDHPVVLHHKREEAGIFSLQAVAACRAEAITQLKKLSKGNNNKKKRIPVGFQLDPTGVEFENTKGLVDGSSWKFPIAVFI